MCVQVKISAEESKSGASETEAAELCDLVASLPNLRLRGLMAIPAPTEDALEQREAFHSLSLLFQSLQKKFEGMDTLSMGMSNDYAAAIAEGSTMIRLGTVIFGQRDP